MTNNRLALTLAAFALIFNAQGLAQKPNNAQVALKAAIDKEMADGDLQGAIVLYEKTIAQSGNDRVTAAKALIRMAECHQKLGNAESRKIYERVVRDYSEQKEQAEVARKRIAEAANRNAGISTRTVWSDARSWGSVSPDGRYLSFADKASSELFLRDLMTGEERPLTNHIDKGDFAEFAIFSPDGKQVAYVWYNAVDRLFELRIIGAQGGAHRVLFKNPDVRYPGPWAWSADGKWIAVQLQRNDRTVQIALLSPADGAYRVLKSVGWGGAGSMAFSPDGRFLAYSLPSNQQPNTAETLILATDGSREVRAVQYPNSRNTPAAWTPDGRHLLFLSNRSGATDLWALPVLDGKPAGPEQLVRAGVSSLWGMSRSGTLYSTVYTSGTTLYSAAIDWDSGRLTSTPAPEFLGGNPGRWSPDGKLLAYGISPAAPGAFSGIRIRSFESGQVRELRPHLRYINDIVWSADGKSFVAAAADLKGRHGIHRVNAETGAVEAIILDEEAVGFGNGAIHDRLINMQPRLSPDGTKLYYKVNFRRQGDHSVSKSRFVVRDLATGKVQEFMALRDLPPGLAYAPSPDGRTVAFETRKEAHGVTAVSLLPLDGGEARELLRVSAPQSLELFDWTPGGGHLLVRRVLSEKGDGELLLYPAGGGAPRKIGIENPHATAVSIHPGGGRITYVVQGAKKGEVLAIEGIHAALERGR